MNKTKKRAHKRAQARPFRFPYPLTHEYKIKNLKVARARFGFCLREAKQFVEDAMIKAGNSPYIPVTDDDLLI